MKKIKIAVAAPTIRLCDPEYNAEACISDARRAAESGARIVLFPELTLTGATCKDLYFQEALTDAAEDALLRYVEATEELDIISFIGLPARIEDRLYNAVAVVSGGELLGINVSNVLGSRHFAPAPSERREVSLAGMTAQLGGDLVFSTDWEDSGTRVKIFTVIGDESVPVPEGVNLVLNPTCMAEFVGLAASRRSFVLSKSSMLGVVYVLAGAGFGESGTDGVYAAPRLAAAGGEVIAEAALFSDDVLYVDADLDAISVKVVDRAKYCEPTPSKLPFVPEDKGEREAACELALELQARGLAGRIERAYAKCAVIGVSGGLDSTLAVLAAARAMDILGRNRDGIIAITMPCFGTTERTKSNALSLAEELGCTVRTIDIKAAVSQHFKDISHAENDYDVVYENAQARERTQILMDVANAEGGLVVGTGDLSELALGFATYNGDHMSMYCVNGSIPKTLMRAMIAYVADNAETEGKSNLSRVLYDVINTPVSPELLPADGAENKQHTERIVGPYELHDFFLWYTVGYGYSPKRVLALAKEAFAGEYTEEQIRSYLEIFVRRFFSQQFKRSCMPDGPRVTKISLSPRGAWQMPSDVSSTPWKKNLL